MTVRTDVYIAYDARGVALYIGASVDVKRRFQQHSSRSHWYSQVARIVSKTKPTKREAFDLETRAIRILKPLHNKQIEQGAKRKWPVPTDEQIAVIVGWWHSDRKPAAITEDARRLMGADVPKSWVRDQVIKATGSAKRKPADKERDT